MPFLRKYNTLTVTGTTAIRIPMIKRAVVDFAVSADWTPSAGDVKIAIDGAAAANVTNLPTAVTMGNTAYWQFILTAAELTCKSCIVTVADSATKAVEDQSFIVETFGHADAMYVADFSLAAFGANTTTPPTTASIAIAVEAAIFNEGDATALLQAIADKVEAALVNEGDATATILAIATAVNSAIVAGTVGTKVGAIHGKLPTATYLTGSEDPAGAAVLDTDTQGQIDALVDGIGWTLAALYGACANPQAADTLVQLTINGYAYSGQYAGLTATGVRTDPTLSKV